MAIEKDSVKVGQHVEYHPVGMAGTKSTGIIKEIITHDEKAGEAQRNVKADTDHPRILIMNDNTHKETAYKLENIERILEEPEGEETKSKKTSKGGKKGGKKVSKKKEKGEKEKEEGEEEEEVEEVEEEEE